MFLKDASQARLQPGSHHTALRSYALAAPTDIYSPTPPPSSAYISIGLSTSHILNSQREKSSPTSSFATTLFFHLAPSKKKERRKKCHIQATPAPHKSPISPFSAPASHPPIKRATPSNKPSANSQRDRPATHPISPPSSSKSMNAKQKPTLRIPTSVEWSTSIWLRRLRL